MRFKNPENKRAAEAPKGGQKAPARRETRPAPKQLKDDDKPQLEGLSNKEAAAVIAAKYGFGKGPNAK